MWWYHGYDAYYEQQALEYELGYSSRCGDASSENAREGRPASDWQIPLRWVMAWIGGLSLISLGLGSLSQWFLL
jgi:hypothetical protein